MNTTALVARGMTMEGFEVDWGQLTYTGNMGGLEGKVTVRLSCYLGW